MHNGNSQDFTNLQVSFPTEKRKLAYKHNQNALYNLSLSHVSARARTPHSQTSQKDTK